MIRRLEKKLHPRQRKMRKNIFQKMRVSTLHHRVVERRMTMKIKRRAETRIGESSSLMRITTLNLKGS
jgi:hypothetical protein